MSKENILLLLDTARKNIFACQVKIEQLEKENAMMRDVLEFYADRANWQSVYVGYGDKSQIKGYDLGDLSCDDRPDEFGGKRAREVLTKLTKGEI